MAYIYNMNRIRAVVKERVIDALELIKMSPEPIAKETFNFIINGPIQFRTYCDLSISDYAKIRQYDIDHGNTLKLGTFLPTPLEIEKMAELYWGWPFDQTIYVSHLIHTTKDMASTIVHEVNHMINQDIHILYSNDEILVETEAFLSEKMLAGERITRGLIQKTMKEVEEIYQINLPTNLDRKSIVLSMDVGFHPRLMYKI